MPSLTNSFPHTISAYHASYTVYISLVHVWSFVSLFLCFTTALTLQYPTLFYYSKYATWGMNNTQTAQCAVSQNESRILCVEYLSHPAGVTAIVVTECKCPFHAFNILQKSNSTIKPSLCCTGSIISSLIASLKETLPLAGQNKLKNLVPRYGGMLKYWKLKTIRLYSRF